MIFRSKQHGEYTAVVFETANLLNGLDIETVEEALVTILNGGANKLIVDFHRVTHASSQALSMILRIHLRTEKLPGGELILCGLNPQFRDAIKILRLDKLIPIFATRDDALHDRKKAAVAAGKPKPPGKGR